MRITYDLLSNKKSNINYAHNKRLKLKQTTHSLLYICLIIIFALSQGVTFWRPQKAAALVAGEYVALGDSYSAGQGTSDMVGPSNCRQANPALQKAWAYQVGFPLTEIYHLACSGAVIDNLRADQTTLSRAPAGAKNKVKLVTVTIGGNDVGFADALKVCIADGLANQSLFKDLGLICSSYLEMIVRPAIDGIKARLSQTYIDIHNAYPNALIVPVTYPYFFPNPNDYSKNNCAAKLTYMNVYEIRELQKYMNDQVMAAANAVGLTVIRAEDAMAGSELCRADRNTTFFTPLYDGEFLAKMPALDTAFFNAMGQTGLLLTLLAAQQNNYGGLLGDLTKAVNQQKANFSGSIAQYGRQLSQLLPERAFHPNEVGQQRYAGAVKPILEAKYAAFVAAGGAASLSSMPTGVVTGATGGTTAPVCKEGPDTVLLYEHINYDGSGRCSMFMPGQRYTNIETAGTLKAGTASSIKMGDRLKIYWCSGFNFTGECQEIDRTEPNMDAANWGNRIRSLEVRYKPAPEPASLGDPTCTEGPDRVVFYENPNFGGTCVGLGIGSYGIAALYKPLGAGTMSSLKVGANVTPTICAQNDFVTCQTFGTDSDLGNDGWADRMVSVKIEKTPPGPVCNYAADQVVIYDWPNYTGWCTTLNIGDTVLEPNTMPGNLNDQIEGIKVGTNAKIWACRDPQLTGICSMISSDTPDLSPTAVGKQQISSYKVYGRSQPGPCDAGYEMVVLFSNRNFDGACQAFGVAEYPLYTALNIVGDNNVESFKVMPGAKVTLCTDAYLSGRCYTSTTDLASFGTTYDYMHNGISSLKVERIPMQTCDPSSVEVAIYDLPNYTGDCTIFEPGDVYSNLGTTNKLGSNRIESIKVGPGRRAILCNTADISGNCDQFNEDTPDLAGTRIGPNATISMLNWPMSDCEAVPGTVVFFDKPNYQGLCNRQALGDINDASSFWLTGDNAVESVAVADNVQVKICTDMNQAGTCAVLRNNEPNLLNTPVGPNAATSIRTELRTFACDRSQYQAEYYNNVNLSGTPAATRCEYKPNYSSNEWGDAAPADAGVGADNFSVRWTNSQNLMAGTYRVITTTDDGVRLWIDNQLVIDRWVNQAATAYTADVAVTSGLHTIKMEYFDSGGGASAKLDLYPVDVAFTPPPNNGACTATEYNAEYFNNTTLTGTPVATRCEASVNNDYGGGAPIGVTGVGVDNFSVRWTNTQNYAAGSVTVSATADDGVRVWVDGTLLIDKWIDQGATTYTSTPTLTAGNHTVKMEYYEKGGGAVAKLQVTPASTPTPPPPPPAPTPPPSPPPATGCAATEYKAEYFNNRTLTAPAAGTRCEATAPNYDWGGNGPTGVGVGVDNFTVRWTNINTYTAGTYRFSATADDGVRVWVDNILAIDKWIDQGATTYTSDQVLSAGSHTVKMEYYEAGGGAVAKLSVAPVTVTPPPVPPPPPPAPTPPPPPPAGSCAATEWKAEYFNNLTLTAPIAGTRCETTAPNYVWNSGGPTGVGVGVDNFSVRWTNTNTYVAGSYKFSVTADDGVRMWLDGTLLVDKWIDQGSTTYSSTQTVPAGTHTVKIEYYERAGGAVAIGSVTKL